jgi:hypothetical protein
VWSTLRVSTHLFYTSVETLYPWGNRAVLRRQWVESSWRCQAAFASYCIAFLGVCEHQNPWQGCVGRCFVFVFKSKSFARRDPFFMAPDNKVAEGFASKKALETLPTLRVVTYSKAGLNDVVTVFGLCLYVARASVTGTSVTWHRAPSSRDDVLRKSRDSQRNLVDTKIRFDAEHLMADSPAALRRWRHSCCWLRKGCPQRPSLWAV